MATVTTRRTMTAPLLLDLFCGAGGASMGYHRAGFRVVGVDLDPKPLRHYPFECYQADALAVLDTLIKRHGEWNGYRVRAVHFSPVCKGYSRLRTLNPGRQYPLLIAEARERAIATGLPWILENVPGAPMQQGIELCGTALGLNVRRHRHFDSSHLLFPAGPCRHSLDNVNVYGHGAWNYRPRSDAQAHWTRTNARQSPLPIEAARVAMGIDWMNRDELAQAIPPAYTEWLGCQLLAVCQMERTA